MRIAHLRVGMCTEVPLERITRTVEHVLLVDVDVLGIAHSLTYLAL